MTDPIKTALEDFKELADCGAEAWGEDRPCVNDARASITALEGLAAQPTNVAELLAQRVVLLNETWNRSNALAPDVADHLAVCRVLAEGVLRKSAAQPQGACHSKTVTSEQQPRLSSQSEEQTSAQPQGEVVAWLTDDGERCVTAQTYNRAKKDGGAIWSSMKPYRVPAYAIPKPAMPVVPHRPDILEKLTYHALERDDLTLDECVAYLAKGWYDVRGRTEREMVLQLTALLATAPPLPKGER